LDIQGVDRKRMSTREDYSEEIILAKKSKAVAEVGRPLVEK
jgi:hypothetical protein